MEETMLSTQDAAARLGMALHEVVAVVATDDGDVVVTHDGVKTLIRPDGELVFTLPDKPGVNGRADAADYASDEAATLSAKDAAAILGMAEREVLAVHAADGGHIVVTHDGTPTLICDSGELVFGAQAIGERLPQPDAEDGAAEGGEEGGDGGQGSGDAMPDGPIDAVLAWVGEDKDRATAALEAERAKEKPRSGLLAKLETLAGVQ